MEIKIDDLYNEKLLIWNQSNHRKKIVLTCSKKLAKTQCLCYNCNYKSYAYVVIVITNLMLISIT